MRNVFQKAVVTKTGITPGGKPYKATRNPNTGTKASSMRSGLKVSTKLTTKFAASGKKNITKGSNTVGNTPKMVKNVLKKGTL
jgi:hypothetical protein